MICFYFSVSTTDEFFVVLQDPTACSLSQVPVSPYGEYSSHRFLFTLMHCAPCIS
jgi:hypothetical protein